MAGTFTGAKQERAGSHHGQSRGRAKGAKGGGPSRATGKGEHTPREQMQPAPRALVEQGDGVQSRVEAAPKDNIEAYEPGVSPQPAGSNNYRLLAVAAAILVIIAVVAFLILRQGQ